MTSNGDFDMAKAEAFGAKVLGFMNGASTTLCLSVGHQTGLFDAMAGREPSRSQQIADAAGLNERYVREWLNALVVSGVVDTTARHRPTRCLLSTPPPSPAPPGQ